MRNVWLSLGVAALVFFSTPGNSSEEAESIRELRMLSNAAIDRHDVPGILSFLHDDYVITISTGSIGRSRGEHGRSFAEHFEEFPDAVYVRTPTGIELSEAFPLAIEQGNWVGTMTTNSGEREVGGLYTAAWKRTEAGWKIYSELFVALYCTGEGC
jgi:ketosteroid isomerase-like protein